MIPIKQLIKQGGKWASKHSTEILTVVSSVGVVATGYFGVRAGMKLANDIQPEVEDRTKKEIAVTVLKDTWPVLTSGGLTMAAIISSGVISKRKYRALATSYAILAEASETYKHKVIEQLGEKKHDEIMGEASKKEFEDYKEGDEVQAVGTDGGVYLCKDGITKQYFRSSADYIRKTQDKVNKFYLQGENFVTVGTWYSYLGLECPSSVVSELGFPATSGIDFELVSTICPNGEPGYYIQYNVDPMTEDEAELYDMNHSVESVYV
jgi:hypothetical protein